MANQPNQDKDKIYSIFAAIERREEAAMSDLYANYSGAIYHQIIKLVGDEETAQELLQDVFVKVWEKIDTYDSKASRPYTWMARIARNRAIDYLRSARAKRTGKTDAIPDYVANDSKLAVEQYTDHIGLKKVLDQLDKDHRLIIDYLYFGGYSQSEAAKTLDIPLGTVKTRSRRAIQQLKNILGKELISLMLPILAVGGLLYKLIQSIS